MVTRTWTIMSYYAWRAQVQPHGPTHRPIPTILWCFWGASDLIITRRLVRTGYLLCVCVCVRRLATNHINKNPPSAWWCDVKRRCRVVHVVDNDGDDDGFAQPQRNTPSPFLMYILSASSGDTPLYYRSLFYQLADIHCGTSRPFEANSHYDSIE